jgi:NAD(P)-dependent dehydrogenase (short-subunit alcohol dehydrogenase family)
MTALADKVANVTGASSGIGYATARLFAQEGAKVVVAARRRAELDALVAKVEEGGKAVAVAGDVRDERWPRPSSKPRSAASAGSTLPSTTPAPSARWDRSPACR